MYTIGLDIGASYTKGVLVDEAGKILARHLVKSSVPLNESATTVKTELLKQVNIDVPQIKSLITTGFGRYNMPEASRTITEITAQRVGAYHYFPRAITIIDIGGQDNKIIRVDRAGKISHFKMNRKCAAGTGAFIEEIAYKMAVPLSRMNQLAKRATEELTLGSYCTVFTATEILTHIRAGDTKENIIRGVFLSVAKRILELDPLEGEVVLTGGVVAYHDIIVEIISKLINKPILVPPEPQLVGAYGAALSGL